MTQKFYSNEYKEFIFSISKKSDYSIDIKNIKKNEEDNLKIEQFKKKYGTRFLCYQCNTNVELVDSKGGLMRHNSAKTNKNDIEKMKECPLFNTIEIDKLQLYSLKKLELTKSKFIENIDNVLQTIKFKSEFLLEGTKIYSNILQLSNLSNLELLNDQELNSALTDIFPNYSYENKKEHLATNLLYDLNFNGKYYGKKICFIFYHSIHINNLNHICKLYSLLIDKQIYPIIFFDSSIKHILLKITYKKDICDTKLITAENTNRINRMNYLKLFKDISLYNNKIFLYDFNSKTNSFKYIDLEKISEITDSSIDNALIKFNLSEIFYVKEYLQQENKGKPYHLNYLYRDDKNSNFYVGLTPFFKIN